MQQAPFSKALIVAVVIVIGFVAYWEYHWRSKGFTISYNDDKILWSSKRTQVYHNAGNATVILGGSRIKFGFDVNTWERLTGEDPIQLAMVGTPARLILKDLANDEKFYGKVIVDLTESQFFTPDTMRSERSAREALQYFYDQTPAQKASASLDHWLQSNLVFLEEGKLGLTSLLNELPVTNRKNMIPIRPTPFTKDVALTSADRQNLFTNMFLADTAWQQLQKIKWEKIANSSRVSPVPSEKQLEILLSQLKIYVHKIRARGGKVIFVRPPSDGFYILRERKLFPRTKFWDRLLEETETPGIHFEDYPATAKLPCVETSHLSPYNAAKYTEQLVHIIQQEYGWTFPSIPVTTNMP